ncbi:MAG TPA: DinB family protein [SAR202 cluster bacterium]|nr:DinB family protein [SAR202 cluster bacterium]
MHALVQMQRIARMECARGLQGLSDEDARKRVEPMNCISWQIGHAAIQRHGFFVAWPQGIDVADEYRPYGTGGPASQPPLDEALTLWQASCDEADAWLEAATEESLLLPMSSSPKGENSGTLIVRNIYHTWCHIGEISAIRQILGHKPPEFVEMYGWNYGEVH